MVIGRFGCPYKKPTTLWVTGSFLGGLNKRCKCTRGHVILSGWKDKKAKSVAQHASTKGSAEYPQQLCREWAKLLKQHFEL